MHNLNLVKVNRSLIDCIKLVGAVRGLLGPRSVVSDQLIDMNRELRESAAECQRILKHMEEKEAKLLLVQDRYVK